MIIFVLYFILSEPLVFADGSLGVFQESNKSVKFLLFFVIILTLISGCRGGFGLLFTLSVASEVLCFFIHFVFFCWLVGKVDL